MKRIDKARFCVGKSGGPNSSVWFVDVRKKDIYFGVRHVGQSIKISIHETGKCHVGLTKAHLGKFPNDEIHKYLKKWERPQIPSNGAVHIGSIRVPTVFLEKSNASDPTTEKKDIDFIRPI